MPHGPSPCRANHAVPRRAPPCPVGHRRAVPTTLCHAPPSLVRRRRAVLTVPCPAVPHGPSPCRANHAVPRRAPWAIAVPCPAVPRGPSPCRAPPCPAVPHGPSPCRAPPCPTVPHGPSPCRAPPCPAVPRGPSPCRAPPCPAVPHGPSPRRAPPCPAVPRGPSPRRADPAGRCRAVPRVPGAAAVPAGRCGRRAQQRVQVLRALRSDPVGLEGLRAAARGEGGLCPELRRHVWPRLLGIDPGHLPPRPAPPALQAHRDRGQVLLDVARLAPRFPPGMRAEQRRVLQEQLGGLILHVLRAHPQLHYYQGLHDVALTLLLVLGQRRAAPLLERLCTHHLRDFMDPTLDGTKHILNYLTPLLQRESPRLHDFMEKAEVGTVFALSWLITWYGHVLAEFRHVLRLYDFFLASHPLMPVYFAAAVVLHREEEVLGSPCDMPSLHQLLSRIPRDLPYERLVLRAQELFQRHPHARLARQHRGSLAIRSFGAFQRAASRQRPEAGPRRQPAGAGGDGPLPAAGRNPLVKAAVWGLSATLGAVALAVTHTALDWAPDFLLRLF
ncbi:TBC1 domain family member 20-like [Phalacrocorax carbo]|uniref:TBC1 domain family member 20-like n=1 Tax=Phalacrocorax carbo TaxID=9209 RepID=UPI00311A2560